MEPRVPTRLSPAEGRRFAFTVGAALAALASVAWWRGRLIAATVLITFAGLLLGTGLLLPARLGPVRQAWMGLATALSKITTPLVMALLYFAVITPVGLLLRVVGRNPLKRQLSSWVARPAEARNRRDMERQF